MTKRALMFGLVGLIGAAAAGGVMHSQAKRVTSSMAAVPSEKGGEDLFGPYEVVENWPKPISSLPGHEKWTWGSMNGVFAESPDRIFLFQRGEAPVVKRPDGVAVPTFGPSLSFPVNGMPFRNISQGPVSSPPGPPGEGGETTWKGKYDVDARWEHCLVVVNAAGDIVEQWTQWDKTFKRPHAVFINPYDATKAVWIVDDMRQAIFKFSNDGTELLQTIGTVNQEGNDETHLGRPTYIAWLPDSTMFVSDGYANSRVVKFDKNGKYLTSWGQKGEAGKETRPGYFNSVHGIAVDPVTRHVYVNDRLNHRVEVFDDNGKFLDQWMFSPTSNVYDLYMTGDRHLWASDDTTSKMLLYDLDGHLLYSWGIRGDTPGALWGAHQISVDTNGSLYIAEAENGRAQMFRPRKGANPEFLVGKPPRGAW